MDATRAAGPAGGPDGDGTGGTASEAADVVVVGGGFAGLQAALTMGRANLDVLVLEDGPTRNAAAAHAHNVLTREATPPADLLAAARADVDGIPTVRRHPVRAVGMAPLDAPGGGFSLALADGGAATARAVLLATGVRDELPDVPGLDDLWGSRAHVCPFCDAHPYTGRRLLVLAGEGPGQAHKLHMLRGWTEDLVAAAPDEVAGLSLAGGPDGGDVHVALTGDRPPLRVDGVFTTTVQVPLVGPATGLDPVLHNGFVLVDAEGATSVPRLWAAGDVTWTAGARMPGGQVVQAMGQASRAAAAITLTLRGMALPEPAPQLPGAGVPQLA